MSVVRVFNLFRDGIVVGNIALAADKVYTHQLLSDPQVVDVYLDSEDDSSVGTFMPPRGVTLQEITAEGSKP